MLPKYIVIAINKDFKIVSAKAFILYKYAQLTATLYKTRYENCDIHIIQANEIETV